MPLDISLHPHWPPWCPHPTPVQASSGQEWYYCRSAWHLVCLWVRLMFGQMYPSPHHPHAPLIPPKVEVWTWVPLTWAHVLLSAMFNRPSWVFKSTPPPPVQIFSAKEWYYYMSAWHLVRLWSGWCLVRCTPPPHQPHAPWMPPPHPSTGI